MATLYTIGHSTRTLDELIQALQHHSIKSVVDIRAFPVSRRMPHFSRAALEESLPQAEIDYLWMKELGGHRKKIRDDSPNIALRDQSFRNYADYMLTPEFETAMQRLLTLAREKRTAYMCAERNYLQCHRRLVSDWLAAHGHEVMHIEAVAPTRPHELSAEARITDGRLIYRGDRLF